MALSHVHHLIHHRSYGVHGSSRNQSAPTQPQDVEAIARGTIGFEYSCDSTCFMICTLTALPTLGRELERHDFCNRIS
jgi:hypothetical protein